MFLKAVIFGFSVLTSTLHASTTDIRFADCPSNIKPCNGYLVDCLGGCAFDRNNSAVAFSWMRAMKTSSGQQVSLADIQAQKDCLNMAALTGAISTGLNKATNSTGTDSPCTFSGSVWHNSYADFAISALNREQCDLVGAEVKGLSSQCQNWKNSASKLGQWIGIGIGSAVGVCLIGLSIFGAYDRYRMNHPSSAN